MKFYVKFCICLNVYLCFTSRCNAQDPNVYPEQLDPLSNIPVPGGPISLQDDTNARHGHSRCNEAQFHSCMHNFDLILNNQSLGFATNEKELSSACMHLNSGIRCLDEFVLACVSDQSQRDRLKDSVRGAFEILKMLCDRNSFHRSEYLEHAPCYRKLAPDFEDCTKELRRVSEDQSVSTEQVCCAYFRATRCSYKLAESQCSKRAAMFLENYTERAAAPITLQCRSSGSGTSESCLKADEEAAASAEAEGSAAISTLQRNIWSFSSNSILLITTLVTSCFVFH